MGGLRSIRPEPHKSTRRTPSGRFTRSPASPPAVCPPASARTAGGWDGEARMEAASVETRPREHGALDKDVQDDGEGGRWRAPETGATEAPWPRGEEQRWSLGGGWI
ncbi:hypothetical protein PVAP13_8KG234707 [Panicum virgatum]|uniref:Uncharacterized protein n=1 Tax=Panicum virgatum TaxID=38727 RepID=A0A8T0PNI4_PANVG|nr:hypothetical protein PVAP13_8KG234707 [Panicum virgatum]